MPACAAPLPSLPAPVWLDSLPRLVEGLHGGQRGQTLVDYHLGRQQTPGEGRHPRSTKMESSDSEATCWKKSWEEGNPAASRGGAGRAAEM